MLGLLGSGHGLAADGAEPGIGFGFRAATPLDALANVQRKRRKPQASETASGGGTGADNAVELAYRHYHGHKEAR